jgi:serine/threonine-protein kinase
MWTRALLAVGAWLLGVAGATAGSLVAVSLIGQSITGPSAQQLTVTAINRALADAGQDPGGAPTAASPSPSPSPSAPARPRHRPAVPARHRTATPAPPAPVTTPPPPAGTLLSSAGGSVLATCQAAGAYLVSWSPQPGYEADDVIRGPAVTARVLFMAGIHGVRMVVSCTGSVPSASVAPVTDDGRKEPGDT